MAQKKHKHKHHKKQEPLPPLSTGIVTLGKAIVAGGEAAANGSSENTKSNPKALAQTSFPDMPNDKKLKAKSVNDSDVSIADIGRHGKKAKSLSQHKDPALPPLSSAIFNGAKGVAAGG